MGDLPISRGHTISELRQLEQGLLGHTYKVLYVGSTDNCDKRYREQMLNISKGAYPGATHFFVSRDGLPPYGPA